ncbi:hypothetical protein K7H09_21200 [Halomonas sp. IOP_14]|uniref:hypothetical protein n=1 Tax=Halomonadaceae TaxID=28256 RepID=UPI00137609FE|nr:MULTISPECIES: hypothetical protein [Halomonas]MCD1588525.1 hypothetical protein [Halomonas sp. IOP_14]
MVDRGVRRLVDLFEGRRLLAAALSLTEQHAQRLSIQPAGRVLSPRRGGDRVLDRLEGNVQKTHV